ncbi:hypothetical protein [Streptomyces sp. NPDC059209]|uniref:hypothetical protein n=1 Tax=Streptomyces sp. NPDC059209 TaxID=3346769 RepID=UPI00368A2E48
MGVNVMLDFEVHGLADEAQAKSARKACNNTRSASGGAWRKDGTGSPERRTTRSA